MTFDDNQTTSILPTTRLTGMAMFGDVLLLSIVLIAGTWLHGTDPITAPATAIEVIAPFVFGWLIMGVLAGAYRPAVLTSVHDTLRCVTVGWFAAVSIGLILRSSPTFVGGVAWPFAIVIAGIGLITLVGWRGLYIVFLERVDRSDFV